MTRDECLFNSIAGADHFEYHLASRAAGRHLALVHKNDNEDMAIRGTRGVALRAQAQADQGREISTLISLWALLRRVA